MTGQLPVLVTGSSSGIGRAAALALARAGIPTWASARRVEALGDLAAAGCHVIELDVADEDSRTRAVGTIEAQHGGIGALVNNAGYAQAGPVEEVSLDMLERQFATNLFGAIRLCQLVLPAMRAHGQGTIVNVGSTGGLIGVPGSSAYDMTKWSLEAFSDALRCEVRHFGIRVILLEPGGVATNFAQTQLGTWPESDDSPYAQFRANHHRRISHATRPGAPGISTADKVAGVVVKAVTARKPKARYKIGVAARVMPRLYRGLPNRVWDRLMARMFPME